jgi:hypothetical protein
MLHFWPLTFFPSHHGNCMILRLTVRSLSCPCPTRVFYWRHWSLTFRCNRVLPLIMVIKSTKLYDPEAYGSVSILPTRIFFFYWLLLRLWPWKTIGSSSHHGDQLYQAVWSWGSRLILYPTYKVQRDRYTNRLHTITCPVFDGCIKIDCFCVISISWSCIHHPHDCHWYFFS